MTKRKKKPSKSSSASEQAPIPPFRTFEKVFAGFEQGSPSDDPLDQAQDLIYQAWDIPNPTKRLSLARKALAICADCADAYMLLAEEEARTLEDALALFEQATAAGKRGLGEAAFAEYEGHFWGFHQTRPYMRARIALAQALWEFGDRAAAISHAQDMLRLNPNDNQGVRHILIGWLLDAGRLSEAQALWQQFEDDTIAWWPWSRVLMTYIEHGHGEAATASLEQALDANPHVPALLLGRKTPIEEESDYVSIGGEDEAAAYVLDNVDVWRRTDGALRWLGRAVPPGDE